MRFLLFFCFLVPYVSAQLAEFCMPTLPCFHLHSSSVFHFVCLNILMWTVETMVTRMIYVPVRPPSQPVKNCIFQHLQHSHGLGAKWVYVGLWNGLNNGQLDHIRMKDGMCKRSCLELVTKAGMMSHLIDWKRFHVNCRGGKHLSYFSFYWRSVGLHHFCFRFCEMFNGKKNLNMWYFNMSRNNR